MADPVSIAGLSLQVAQILGPIVKALWEAYRDGKTVHDSLKDLGTDLDALYELTSNIHRLFNLPRFLEDVRGVKNDTNVEVMVSLKHSLEGCSKEAQGLLSILEELGLQARTGRLKQAKVQWRLHRRVESIDRLKRNFGDHKSTMHLAFQLLNTCVQMKIADRDARHAAELKVQIHQLQKAIEQISQHIAVRQQVQDDNEEEQTQIVGDMKEIQEASLHLQRRATMRLEYLTSLSEIDGTTGPRSTKYTSLDSGQSSSQPPLLKPVHEDDEEHPSRSDPASPALSSPRSPDTGDLATTTSLTRSISALRTRHASVGSNFGSVAEDAFGERPASNWGSSFGSKSFTNASFEETPPLSPQEFEENVAGLLSKASAQGMGIKRSYSDDLVVCVAELLSAVGKKRWSARPRTYLVLRLIDEIKLMDDLVLDGFKDIDFPYTDATLPPCIIENGVQRDFLTAQRYVLSERLADLVRGGKHRHFDKSADTFFTSLGKLGTGGSSIVDKVRVRSRLTHHEYARKRIDKSSAFAKNRKALEFFENEVRTLKRLSHDHLVKFVGSYTDRKHVGIIILPVADSDLHQHLSKGSWTDDELSALRSWIGCLSSALAYLHENKCRHKDIKPQNILIKGEAVMFADFGTALDWTEFESDITTGTPNAYTKLYVAPEVAQQLPRDTSSDVWSLGCIFIEMATILVGLSLREKSEFFTSPGSSTAAYWRKHDAISRWCALLQTREIKPNGALYTWIQTMTALDPGSRPTAKHLVGLISTEQSKESGYTRSCCFDDPHSDSTSWQGSDLGEDEIFETANTTSDMTTKSSVDASAQIRLASKPHTADRSTENMGNTNMQQVVKEVLDELQDDLTCRHVPQDAESSEAWPGPTDLANDELVSTREDKRHRLDLEDSISTQLASLELQSRERSILPDNARGLQDDPDPTLDQELLEAFYRSPERFELILLKIKKVTDTWRLKLLPIIKQGLVDRKGLNILIMASKFGNTLLAADVVNQVIENNVALIKSSTIFGNTGLHYAASRGNNNIIARLVEHGAKPGAQNWRGVTALSIAIWRNQFKSTKLLTTTMSLEDLDTVDDLGNAAIHHACQVSQAGGSIEVLLQAGCSVTRRNNWGETPLRICVRIGNTKTADMVRSHMPRNSSDLNENVAPSMDHYWQSYTDLDEKECTCCWCALHRVIKIEDGNLSKRYSSCPCPNHVKVFADDALFPISDALRSLQKCRCKACSRGREYNATHPPCGTPIGKDYLPYDDTIRKLALSSMNLQSPMHMLSLKQVADGFIHSYPGHQYYDKLIEEKMSLKRSSLSQEEITAMALNSFTDAGFKGARSYRRFPNDALRWIINNYEDAIHVTKMLEILLDCGADINTTNRNRGLLAVAAEKGDLALVMLLLERNATVDPEEIRTGPERSKATTRSMAFELLRQQVQGPQDALSKSLTKGERNPLRAALLNHRILIVRTLLQAGANVNRVEKKDANRTPLHSAILHYDMLSEHVPLLLAHGALLETRDSNQNTPLIVAISLKHYDAARTLLQSGADANAVNVLTQTPLSVAIEIGGTIEIVDSTGFANTVYDVENTGYSRRDSSDTSDMVRCLSTYGADIHAPCNGSQQPCALFWAFRVRNSAVAQLIIEEYSALDNISRLSKRGDGCLHFLACLPYEKAAPLMDRILSRVRDLNTQNVRGNTPLHIAAFQCNIMYAKKLVERKAITGVLNKEGNTPIGIARPRWSNSQLKEVFGPSVRKRLWDY